jgi:hypothetical protein
MAAKALDPETPTLRVNRSRGQRIAAAGLMHRFDREVGPLPVVKA